MAEDHKVEIARGTRRRVTVTTTIRPKVASKLVVVSSRVEERMVVKVLPLITLRNSKPHVIDSKAKGRLRLLPARVIHR